MSWRPPGSPTPRGRAGGRTHVRLDAEQVVELDRAYTAVDAQALRVRLAKVLGTRDAEIVDDTCVHAAHDDAGVEVRLASGATWRARLLIDATGHRPRFTARVGPEPSAFQCAWGVLCEVTGDVGPADVMTLMDWSEPGPGAPSGVPTFLYAMPLADGRVFFEETALCARPAVPFSYLRARLQARLAARGVQVARELDVERCLIPMDAPAARPAPAHRGRRRRRQPRPPPPRATCSPRPCARPSASPRRSPLPSSAARPPARLAALAWSAVWPAAERGLHRFFALGRDLTMGLDAAATRDFFAAFFALPPSAVRAYLSREVAPARTLLAMTRLYARFDAPLRHRLHREVLRRPAALLRGLARPTGAP
jgi:lycopene beta-cyclase